MYDENIARQTRSTLPHPSSGLEPPPLISAKFIGAEKKVAKVRTDYTNSRNHTYVLSVHHLTGNRSWSSQEE